MRAREMPMSMGVTSRSGSAPTRRQRRLLWCTWGLGAVALLVVAFATAWLQKAAPEDGAMKGRSEAARPIGPALAAPAARVVSNSDTGARTSSIVFGVVQSADGRPLQGASVCAVRLAGEHVEANGCRATRADGAFELNDVGPAAAGLVASAVGYVSRTEALARDRRGGLTIVLDAGGRQVSGIVLDAMGGAVAGALVIAQVSADPRALTTSLADPAGRFTANVAPGLHLITVQADGYSSERREIIAPNPNLSFVLTPASALAGRVVAQGADTPVDSVRVVAASTDAASAEPRTVATDAAGTFRIDRLSAGSYELSASGANWRSAPQQVNLGVGESLDGLTLVVTPAVSLRALVRIAGEPCRYGSIALSGRVPVFQELRGDGSVEVPGLWPGSYEVTVSCAEAVGVTERIEVGSTDIERSWDLDGGWMVRGTVLTALGAPVPSTRVDVFAIGEPTNRPNSACSTDTAGDFACRGLMRGDYELRVGEHGLARVTVSGPSAPDVLIRLAPTGRLVVDVSGGLGVGPGALLVMARRKDETPVLGQWREHSFVFDELGLGTYDVYLEQLPGAQTSVRLSSAGEVVHLQLRAPPRTMISGRVLDESGMPVSDAWVAAKLSDSEMAPFAQAAPPALTNAEGDFSLRDLFERPYDITASAPAGKALLQRARGGDQNIILRLRPQGDTVRGEASPSLAEASASSARLGEP